MSIESNIIIHKVDMNKPRFKTYLRKANVTTILPTEVDFSTVVRDKRFEKYNIKLDYKSSKYFISSNTFVIDYVVHKIYQKMGTISDLTLSKYVGTYKFDTTAYLNYTLTTKIPLGYELLTYGRGFLVFKYSSDERYRVELIVDALVTTIPALLNNFLASIIRRKFKIMKYFKRLFKVYVSIDLRRYSRIVAIPRIKIPMTVYRCNLCKKIGVLGVYGSLVHYVKHHKQ